MKKMFVTFIALFTLQIGLAQGSPEAKVYVQNAGIAQQLNTSKAQILPNILEENTTDFNKEFDEAVQNYLTELESLVAVSFNESDLKLYNESVAAGTVATELMPNDAQSFQERAQALQMSFGETLNSIIQKHVDPAILQ